MKFHTTDKIRLSIPKAALTTVFDGCDTFDQDETGGRVIGTFEEHRGKLAIYVTGIIEAGPQARRSAVSFFQDGEYQEQVFRKIEDQHQEIEHLGNWHTHHVNGLQHLSGGDIETYYRTVNHASHNTSFFYALLVTAKHKTSDPLYRYRIKHYVFRRGDESVYEIPQRLVEITNSPLLWPPELAHDNKHKYYPNPEKLGAQPERVFDRDIVEEFYQGIRPFASEKLGLYWRGSVELLDGTRIQVVVLEDSSARRPSYSIVLSEPPDALKDVAGALSDREFPSARAALITTERSCNKFLYELRGRLQE